MAKELEPSFTYPAKVMNIVDGDTYDLMIDLGHDVHVAARIRLLGVDTPETRTKDLEEKRLGLEAKQRVIDLHLNEVTVRTVKKDSFGRWLADLQFRRGGMTVDLAEFLILNQLAKPVAR